MGRIELPDKRVDWVSVTEDYLHELYDEIKSLKAQKAELEQRLRQANSLPQAA